MEELTAKQAAEIIGVSYVTIHSYANRGLLPGRREGVKRVLWIKVSDLREFAQKYGVKFDENVLGRVFGNE